jgi:hypothetical protein
MLHYGFQCLPDFNADITNAVLLPLLVVPKVIPDIEEHWSQVRDAPTGASLASLVSEMISLNRKQAIVIPRILPEVLSWTCHLCNLP